MDVTIYVQSSGSTVCFALCLDLLPHQISACAHITSILQMCCSYAETRPGQQEAYEHLKKHLDKVTYLQRRLLNQKRRRSRERGVRIMPAILSSGHGQGTMESELDELDQHAASSMASIDPEVNKEISENETQTIRPLTHVLHELQNEVEDMPVLHEADAEASLRDQESHGLSQSSLSLSPESIGSFDGSVDLDHLPGSFEPEAAGRRDVAQHGGRTTSKIYFSSTGCESGSGLPRRSTTRACGEETQKEEGWYFGRFVQYPLRFQLEIFKSTGWSGRSTEVSTKGEDGSCTTHCKGSSRVVFSSGH